MGGLDLNQIKTLKRETEHFPKRGALLLAPREQ